MVGDDISAVDHKFKVFLAGVAVNLTSHPQIPVPGSVSTSSGLMFKLHDSDPRTVKMRKKKLSICVSDKRLPLYVSLI